MSKCKNGNILLRMAGVALVLVLLSAHLLSGLYAKYTTSATGSDGARVARFDIGSKVEGQAECRLQLSLAPGDAVSKTIEVINSSEVTLSCRITVTNETGNLPLQLSLKESKDDAAGSTVLDRTYAPEHNATHSYLLVVEWPAVTGEENHIYQGMLDNITVTLHYEQID